MKKKIIFITFVIFISCNDNRVESEVVGGKDLVHEIDYKKYPLIADGVSHIFDKEYEKAILTFDRAEIEYGPNSDILMNRSACYFQLKDYESSINDLNNAIKLDSNYIALYISRGLSYTYNKNFDLAEIDFSKAIKELPNESVIYVNRASMYIQMRLFNKGCEDLNTAIELGYREKYNSSMADDMINEYCN